MDGLSNYEHLKPGKEGAFDEGELIEALQDGLSLVEALTAMDPKIFQRN